MKLETRPYEDGDMEYVRANPFQEEVKNYPDLPIPEHTYTCVFDGEIVAVGGVKMLGEDSGEAWIIMTKQSRKDHIFGLIACRAITDKLDSLILELELKVCQARVKLNFAVAIRFIEALGFTIVREIKGYFPDGVSALLYSKVCNEHI